MKRLLSAGYSKLFQICKCFRKGERGERHFPEFTLLEWYCVDRDYFDLMNDCEELVRFIAGSLGDNNTLIYQGNRIDLETPWPKITVREAFERFASISIEDALKKDSSGVDKFDEVIGIEIEPKLGRKKPVFLYDYPASRGALSRLKPDDPTLSQRFELYIAGIELCNGFTELTDQKEQEIRFEKELDMRKKLKKDIYPMPEKFLKELGEMPEAAGNALGIDRLVMLFADVVKIDDVAAFTPEEL